MSLSSCLLTCADSRHLDAAALKAGVSFDTLMEQAGFAVACAISRAYKKGTVAVLCGPGNNGGDGFVIARVLQNLGWRVAVFTYAPQPRAPQPAPLKKSLSASTPSAIVARDIMRQRWRDCGGREHALHDVVHKPWNLIVDALFGSGLTRALDTPVQNVLFELSKQECPVVAVDMPSGVDGTTGHVYGKVLPARHTMALARPRPGHFLLPGCQLCGMVKVVDIGIPPTAFATLAPSFFINTPSLWRKNFPPRLAHQHKYDRGHVLVVAGEAIKSGASRLAAYGALRAGSGLVTIAAPTEALQVQASHVTAVMLTRCDGGEDLRHILSDRRITTLVLGPGGGVGEALGKLTLTALTFPTGLVCDADVLTVFANNPKTFFSAIKKHATKNIVLTPHYGEFARLFAGIVKKYDDKVSQTVQAARLSGAVVVHKGADTVIAAPDGRAVINATASSALATAGSGDVLAGIVAALMAQGMATFEAACAAVWIHGTAGRGFGLGLIAEDIPKMLPEVLSSLVKR